MHPELPYATSSRLWTTWQLLRHPHDLWPDLVGRHGRTFVIRAWNGDVVCTGDPAVLKDLFKATTFEVKPFAVERLAPVLGTESVLTIAGARHQEARRLLMPAFHGARMKAYTEGMIRVTDRVSSCWGSEIVALDEMLAISLEVIARAVFGAESDADVVAHTAAVRRVVSTLRPELLFTPFLLALPVGPGAAFLAARAEFQALVMATIARRRAGARGPDILSMLLDATHEDGSPASDAEVHDQLLTLLFAGHETTQIAMAWMLYHLARHPVALAKVDAELAGWTGGEELERFPYLDAVVTETLRLHPIVPDFVRTLQVPLTLGGHPFPAGTHVAPIAAMLHVDPELYPEPHAFRPERHLDRTYKPHELIPFGGGVRRCIGAALATWEMKVVVGTLLRRFRFRSLGEEVATRRNATTGPKHGVRLAVSPLPVA